MKVVLLKTVEKIGTAGEVVTVSDGYARNFLIAKGLACIAGQNDQQKWEEGKKREDQKNEEKIKESQDAKVLLEKTPLHFSVKTSKDGGVFSSVQEKDIVEKITQLLNQENPKNSLTQKELHIKTKPIKELGPHEIPIKIGPSQWATPATIHITIEAE